VVVYQGVEELVLANPGAILTLLHFKPAVLLSVKPVGRVGFSIFAQEDSLGILRVVIRLPHVD